MNKVKYAALAVLLACGLVRADGVLEKLPANALVGGRVANLQATSNKIAKLAKDLGIDAFAAPLQNPLANLKSESHIEKGLNEAGEIGFAFLDPKAANVKPDDAFVVLIPVSNYAEFLTNFGEAKTEAGISEVQLPDGPPKPMFVADWEGYAAISSAKELLAKPSATMKPAGLVAKEAAKQDFLVVANFKEISAKALPEMDKGVDQLMAQFDKAGAKDLDPKYKPLVKAAITQLFAAGKTFLGDAEAATVGLNISDAGINTTVLSNFKPDSYLGKLAGQIKGSDKPLTVGLPAMKYLAYGGSVSEPTVVSQVFNDLAGPVIAELNKIEGVDAAKQLVASMQAAIKANTGQAFGMPAPTKIGQEGLFQTVSVFHGGGDELKAVYGQAGTFARQVITDMKLPEDRPKPTLDLVQNAKTIEGVSFDNIHFEAKPNPDAPNAAQAEQMQNLMYGPAGINYTYGTLGKDFVLYSGASDETVAAFIKAAKAGEENLAKLDQVKVVAAELPKTRSVEYYVALDEWVNTGVSAASQFGLPVQVQLPPDLPPLGVTAGAEGTALRIDTHLPTTTLQSLIAAGMQAFMGMRGGGGGNL